MIAQGWGTKRADTALHYLVVFVRTFNQIAGGSGDHSDTLFTSNNSCAIAIEAWRHMQTGWSSRHVLHVRTHLSRALFSLPLEVLAYAINPTLRLGTRVKFRCHQSAYSEVLLHHCIPIAVRRNPDSLLYLLLAKTLDSFGRQVLTAVSKGNMQRIALLFKRIYCSLLDNASCAGLFDTQWGRIQQLSAYQWLRLYGSTTLHKKSFVEFRKDISHLRRMHSIICHGEPPHIPIPTLAIVDMDTESDEEDTGYMSIGSSGTECESGLHMKEKLQRELSRIQIRVCHVDGSETDDIQFAFNPSHVEEVILAAHTVQERLFVLLLLSFGLRIGGLSRLAYSVDVVGRLQAAGPKLRHVDVPDCANTIEKFGKKRCISPLSQTIRVLIAQWFRWHRRPTQQSAYIFPGSDLRRSMSRTAIWKVVKTILSRTSIPHRIAHPHTFRHTLVHLLHARGLSFEQIAKWIGHSDCRMTASVYGRIRMSEVAHVVGAHVGFLGVDKSMKPTDWNAVVRLMTEPYNFSAQEQFVSSFPRVAMHASNVLSNAEKMSLDVHTRNRSNQGTINPSSRMDPGGM